MGVGRANFAKPVDLLSIKEAPTFYVKTPILRNYEITKLRNDEMVFRKLMCVKILGGGIAMVAL